MNTLRIFCDVARHRSFSAAAAEHGMTQSAASQRIGQLEKRLGVVLIDRSVRPLTLTSAGDVFLRGCRELLDRYDRLERQISQLRPRLDGEVRVDAIYSAGIDLLNQMKENFEARHPQVRVILEYKRPEEVYEAVRQQRCDLGIVSYPQAWRDVASIPLRDEPMAVVCAAGHALAARRRVHASELGPWPMAMFEPELPVARRIRKYLREHGVTPNITSMFDNIDTIKSAVAVTDQIAILPRRTVAREVLAGTLAVVELSPELSRPMGIIHHRRARGSGNFSPAAQSFIDHLLEHAGPSVDLVARIEGQHRSLVGVKS